MGESGHSSTAFSNRPEFQKMEECCCIAVIKWIWTLVKRPFIRTSASLSLVASSVVAEPVASSTFSSTAVEWKYDVYLSFGAPDTRKGMIFELDDQLQRRGIKTFMDDRDLEEGDPISPTLTEAIQESRFAVVVLSRDYISSSWCLEELTTICEYLKDNNRILLIRYHLEPSGVHFRKRSFNEAFSKHEISGQHASGKMQRWRNALQTVARFSCWDTQNYNTHKELVEVLVKFLHSEVLPDAIGSTEEYDVYEEPRQAMVEVLKEPTIESPASQRKHDVFLSFRGVDTRKGIVSYLYYELQVIRGIRTFMDETGLEAGTEISSNLSTAIKESKSAVVIFSPHYAASAWCLDELANIVHGLHTRNTKVLPVFYNVEPHDVRYQTGSYAEAFTRHGKQIKIDKVTQWRTALTKVAGLSGVASKNYRSDRHLVEGIAQIVSDKLQDQENESPGDKAVSKVMMAVKVMMAFKVMKAFREGISLRGLGGSSEITVDKHDNISMSFPFLLCPLRSPKKKLKV